VGKSVKEALADDEYGELEGRHVEDGEIHNGRACAHVAVPERPRFLNPRDWAVLAFGDADAAAYQDGYERAKKSQEGFHNRISAQQAMMLIIGFCVGFGAVVLALQAGSALPGGSVTAMAGVSVGV